MSHSKPRKPRKKDLRNTHRRKPDDEWAERVGTLYYHHEVPHPFVDLDGAPITYLNALTGEQMVDLIRPDGSDFKSMPVAEAVLLAFEGSPQTDELVPCYRDGDVLNAALTNIYWGPTSHPNSGLSLHRA